MNDETQMNFQLKGPWAIAAIAVILLLGGGYLFVSKPGSLQNMVLDNAYDTTLSPETIKEKTDGPVLMELQRLYREKYMAKLVESPDRLKPEVAKKIVEINRAIDSIKVGEVTVKKRSAYTDSNDIALLVTVNYTMTPPLDNTTTRTFNVEAKNNGRGSWTFYGEK